MSAARLLAYARRRAGLSQRDLAQRSAMAQPAIARIESGAVTPRLDTLDRLLRSCGVSLSLDERLGTGIDATTIRELLRLTPRQRMELAVTEARNLEALGS